jgi:hypothetical protein
MCREELPGEKGPAFAEPAWEPGWKVHGDLHLTGLTQGRFLLTGFLTVLLPLPFASLTQAILP